MNSIEKKALDFIKRNRLLHEVHKVYVATSGGADSMSLLAFMVKFKDNLGVEVAAVHVNHGIRGETARRDANFVKEYCKTNNIEFALFDAEADKTYVPLNASEEWARQLRYGYFTKISGKGIKIATAHTLSDQLETVLFRMARGGSGLNGMTGIPSSRGDFIRPFLCITRSEVEELVTEYNTGNITDETNLGDDYSRNKIRHHVVPVLKQINKNAEESVGKLCNRLDKAQQYIHKQAMKQLRSGEIIPGIKYHTQVFLGLDEIILDEMLIQLLLVLDTQSEQMVEVLKSYIYSVNLKTESEQQFGVLQVSDTQSIVVTNDYITVLDERYNSKRNCYTGYNSFGNFGYGVEVYEVDEEYYKNASKDKFNLCNFTDSSKLNLDDCIIRNKKAGDIFKPACRMKGKLVKFMRSIPLSERDSVPVIERNGEIIWVWGVGFTDGYTPTMDSIKAGAKVYEFVAH